MVFRLPSRRTARRSAKPFALAALIGLGAAAPATAQVYGWDRLNAQSNEVPVRGNAVAADAAGNSYFVTSNVTVSFTDVQVVKRDPSNNQVWSTFLTGLDTPDARSIALDAAGNLFVTGAQGPDNAQTLFVVRLDPSGTQTATYISPTTGDGNKLVADPVDGQIFVAGEATNTGTGDADPVVLRLENDLTNPTQLYRETDPAVFASYFSIDIDAAGDLYMSRFDNFAGGAPAVKIDQTGTLVWNATSFGPVIPFDIKVPASAVPPTVFLAGGVNTGLDFDSFLVGLNPTTGSFDGGVISNHGGPDYAYRIALTSDGTNLVIAGVTGNDTAYVATFPGSSDFVASAAQFASDDPGTVPVPDLALDGLDNAYVIGSFSGQGTTSGPGDSFTLFGGPAPFSAAYYGRLVPAADAPLPVELSAFSGSSNGQTVTLSWTTATELNNAGFVVLRDGIEIASFRATDALKGHGTSASANRYAFTDSRVRPGRSYSYTIRSVDQIGLRHDYPAKVTVEVGQIVAPTAFVLSPASPNPFNPTTTLQLSLPEAADVTATLYDALGRQVRTLANGPIAAGTAPLTVSADGLPTGAYLVRVTAVGAAGTNVSTQRITLMK